MRVERCRSTHHHSVESIFQIVRILAIVQIVIVIVDEFAIDDRRFGQTGGHKSFASLQRVLGHAFRWLLTRRHVPSDWLRRSIVTTIVVLNIFIVVIGDGGVTRRYSSTVIVIVIVHIGFVDAIDDRMIARTEVAARLVITVGHRSIHRCTHVDLVAVFHELFVPQNRFLGHRGQIWRRIEIFERKIDHFLRFDPFVVDEIESLQMHNQNGRQFPYLQFLGGRFLAFAMRTVIPFFELLFGGECTQTMIQIDRFNLLFSAQRQRLVFGPNLGGENWNELCSSRGILACVFAGNTWYSPALWYFDNVNVRLSDPNRSQFVWHLDWFRRLIAAVDSNYVWPPCHSGYCRATTLAMVYLHGKRLNRCQLKRCIWQGYRFTYSNALACLVAVDSHCMESHIHDRTSTMGIAHRCDHLRWQHAK